LKQEGAALKALVSFVRQSGTFLTIWSGQTISLVGSVLTEFALGVWVFQRTHSTTQFALISLFIVVPPILVSPLAGVLADRHDRRRLMLVANLGGALVTLLLAILVATSLLTVWLAYAITLLFAIFSTLLAPSLNSSLRMLVDRSQLSRANGLLQLANSLSRMVAPPLGALLLVAIGLSGIAVVDGVTFLLAAGVLLPATIPPPKARPGPRRSMWADAAEGLTWVAARRALLGLLVVFALVNVTVSYLPVLAVPLVLRFASTQALGFVVGTAGAGLVAGSVLMSVWAGPKRHIHGVLLAAMGIGLTSMLIGLRASLPLIAIGTFLNLVCVPIAMASSQAIWQALVPPELQGRVLGSLRTVTFVTVPLVFVSAGPLADNVFEPLMAPGGALAGTFGPLIGVGPGRGIGLLLILLGLIPIATGIAGYLWTPLRTVEHRAEPERAPGPEAAAPAVPPSTQT
jgi:MFS transporter, DHA3 family, macrolide efflux protein